MNTDAKLAGVHPRLSDAVDRIRLALSQLGVSMIVTDGVRTTEQQQALYAQGRTVPGPGATTSRPLGSTVTNADGVRHLSNHQAHADGFGHAVDCAFLVDGKPSWDESLPWRLYGEAAKALGLRWGGEFVSITDRPHIELPEGS